MMPGELDADRFDQTLRWIGQQFRVLPPLNACMQLIEGEIPPRAAILTFDDGYRDNHDVALPILKRHDMTAAFFIAPGYLDDGVQFNDRLTEAFRDLRSDLFDARWLDLGLLPCGSLQTKLVALEEVRAKIKYFEPSARTAAVQRVEAACESIGSGLQRGRVMMTADEVIALARNGMEIGAHTVMHPILQSVDDANARAEIQSSREILQSILGHPPVLFAYPNGKPGHDFDHRHVEMVRQAGFSFAFSTERGVATPLTDRMLLPRFMPWHTAQWRFKLEALRVAFGR